MAQQKSEDRVVPDGGVMPVQLAGSSAGGQGKAVSVEEAAMQLRLPIATAEAPCGAPRRRSPDQSGDQAAGLPKAVVNEKKSAPATMDEVVERLGLALLKVVSNRGAPGADGVTVQVLQEQWPTIVSSCKPICWRDRGVRARFAGR